MELFECGEEHPLCRDCRNQKLEYCPDPEHARARRKTTKKDIPDWWYVTIVPDHQHQSIANHHNHIRQFILMHYLPTFDNYDKNIMFNWCMYNDDSWTGLDQLLREITVRGWDEGANDVCEWVCVCQKEDWVKTKSWGVISGDLPTNESTCPEDDYSPMVGHLSLSDGKPCSVPVFMCSPLLMDSLSQNPPPTHFNTGNNEIRVCLIYSIIIWLWCCRRYWAIPVAGWWLSAEKFPCWASSTKYVGRNARNDGWRMWGCIYIYIAQQCIH